MARGDTLQGRRVPDEEWFSWQADGEIEPGDYGCQTVTEDGVEMVAWFDCTPDGEIGMLAVHKPDRHGSHHVITIHDDDTISVGGSIRGHVFRSDQISGGGPISSPTGWHGWLERGVWREA